MMKKRLLSIFTCLSLTASAFAFSVGAAPALAGTQDTAMEILPVPEQSEQESTAILTSGPSPVLVQDTVYESNTEFGTPALLSGAALMADLSGEGTEESPYLITSADDLFLMAHNVNTGVGNTAHYKLTADIDLGGQEWAPIGHYTELEKDSVAFCGVFDGDGHTVSNFKITKEDTYYIGLFGQVTGGTIKNVNVDSVNIDVDFSSSQTLYIGGLVGRMLTRVPDSLSSITKCNVSNVSINAHNLGSIYAGGIGGSVVSGDFKNASIFIAFSNVSDADITITSNAKNHPAAKPGEGVKPHMVRAGGFIGFISAQTNSTLTVINSSASANLLADASGSGVAQAMSGGMFSDIWTYEAAGGGKMTISSCYSEGTAHAYSDFYPYVVGGFAAQIYPTKDLTITDCYSDTDVFGKFLQAGAGDGNDPTAGGFMGQLFFNDYVVSYGKTIKNCYGSGDVVDLTHTDETPKDYSFVGGFMGWSTSNVFENCYRFEAQNVVGSDLNYADNNNITVLSEQDSKYLDKYIGFDMNKTWQMDPEAEYFYPTLQKKIGYANFVHDGVSFATDVFGTDGRISEPSVVPQKAQTVDKVYVFNYWSLSENGVPFNFGGDTLTGDTTFYSVFKSEPRSYKITFKNEGSVFSTSTLGYGSFVKAPTSVPKKQDDDRFYYTFSHWSDIAEGKEFDLTDYTVVGEKTFYAVYNAIDKTAWTGSVADEFGSGFGTEALPYIIKTADEFALFEKVINENDPKYTDAYYVLGADINLGGHYWKPIGNSINHPFSAHFDGCGYSVSNFKITAGQYTGLFGVVINGTIKNLKVSNFEYKFNITSNNPEFPAYVGGLAAYVTSERGTTEISGIQVSANVIDIEASVQNVFAGGIVGYASAYISGRTYINDSFAANNMKINNTAGYNYLGGITGRIDTGSSSLSTITHCYSTGSLDSKSYHSSRVGGITGYLYSYGSDYTMPPGTAGVENDENLSSETATLAADDKDIMLIESFAITHITSESTKYTSYAGKIAGEINEYAGTQKVYYPNIELTFEAINSNPKKVKINTTGTEVAHANFKNQELLAGTCGFDFTNTWIFINSADYPVLKCMVSDKPVFKLSSSVIGGAVNATIQVLGTTENYTVIVGVYNNRNQLISSTRKNLSNTGMADEFEVSFDNAEDAEYIAVSVIDKFSFKPLFEGIKQSV